MAYPITTESYSENVICQLKSLFLGKENLLKRVFFGIMLTLLIASMLTITPNVISEKSRMPISNTAMASTSLLPSLVLLGGGARWAAGDGDVALYVNWFDNLIAHPNPLTPDPYAYLPARTSISSILGQYGFSVELAADIPTTLTEYDVVVITAYWAVEPRHEPLIRNYVSNGGSVVLISAVPAYFVAYDKDLWPTTDLNSIQEWFGARMYMNTGGYANVTVDNPVGTPLLTGDTLVEERGYSSAAVTSLNNDTLVLAKWGTELIFAFTYEYGEGRIYYQAEFESIPVVSIESISRAPTTPNYDEDVVVTAIIEDDVGVDQAFLSYTLEAAWHNVSMNKFGDVFNATIPSQPYETLVQYKIYANDTNGVWVFSSTHSYTVSDLTPPEIGTVDWTPEQPASNDTVRVTANISEPVDASGVSKVLFSFMDYFGQWWNTTMTYDDATSLWNVIIPQQPHNTTVKFYMIAYDNAGNTAVEDNSGEYYLYTVIPEFPSFLVLPLFMIATLLAVMVYKRKHSMTIMF